jgi:hypothetical protein
VLVSIQDDRFCFRIPTPTGPQPASTVSNIPSWNGGGGVEFHEGVVKYGGDGEMCTFWLENLKEETTRKIKV